ncbi:MAG: ComF family protein [Candidatus Omnitrophica bacterium]|nr:ComF family protein [Candidatus Omnitrophota bacterium]
MGKFSLLLEGLRNIIYPKLCLICKQRLSSGSIDGFVCPGCWSRIKKTLPPFCRRCGRQLQGGALDKHICASCIRNSPHFDRAFSPCAYEGVIKELIQEFKYKRKDYLGYALSSLLIDFIKEYSIAMDIIEWIIPVPLHKTRMREREFNQAQIIAAYIASEFKIKMLEDNLIRHRYTKTQTDLEGQERLLNVQNSFSVKDNKVIRGKNILLIDDVLTTGATSSEAASALKAAGAGIVFVATLAN